MVKVLSLRVGELAELSYTPEIPGSIPGVGTFKVE